MASNSVSVEPMTEAERRDMLRLIEQRRNDLIEKRKLLEVLSKEDSKKFGTTATPTPEPSDLLKEVMTAMSEAQAIAAEKPAVAPTDLEPVIDIRIS